VNLRELAPPIESLPGIDGGVAEDLVAEEVEEIDEASAPGSQRLYKNVRKVKVGGFRQVLGEKVRNGERVLDDFLEGGGRCCGEGGDEEYLYDLECKICVLDIELHESMGRDAGHSCAGWDNRLATASKAILGEAYP
jgi:hypothetical protein